MGQKTHPYGFRLGIIKPWRSRWYAGGNFAEPPREDEPGRKYPKTRLAHAAIPDAHIERKPGKVTVTVFTGRPGVYVPVSDSVASFREILEGKVDGLPEQAFFLAGTIDDVRANAKKLES